MGDKKQNKRRKKNKNDNKENISSGESAPTSPQEPIKRKKPSEKKLTNTDGGRVTRSRKTDVNNGCPGQGIFIDGRVSETSRAATSQMQHPISGPAASVSTVRVTRVLNGSQSNNHGMIDSQGNASMSVYQLGETVPENWEDSELYFSSHDDSIEEDVQPYISCENKRGGEQGLAITDGESTELCLPTGSSSDVLEAQGHDNTATPTIMSRSTGPSGGILSRDNIEGSATVSQQQTSGTAKSNHDSHKSRKFSSSDTENTCNKEFANNILDTLAAMNAKLQKIDVIESLALETKKEVTGVNNRIDNISKQLEAVKEDLKTKESKWEKGVTELRAKVNHIQSGCVKIEKRWIECKGFYKKELDIVQTSVDSNSTRLGEMEQELADYKKKMESLENMRQNIIEAAEQKVIEKSTDIEQKVQKKIREDLKENKKRESDNAQFGKLKDRAKANKLNLLIFGIPESDGTVPDTKLSADFFKEQLSLGNISIEKAFRLGSPDHSQAGRPRPILVKFNNIRDRWAVWNKKSEIKRDKNNPVWIQEDQPKQLRMEIRKLQRIVRTARDYPEVGEVKIKDFCLSVNGKLFNMNELHLLPSVITPESAYTPRSDEVVIFFTKNSPLSNHHSSPFSLEGQRFMCIEQFLAVHRAFLAKDKALARKAMAQTDPVQHKIILNTLKEDQPDVWKEKVIQIILDATRAKFRQNQHLRDFLVGTYPRQIGEASRDEFWGTGLTLENGEAMDPTKWAKDGNLLGRTLQQVRGELMADAFTSN